MSPRRSALVVVTALTGALASAPRAEAATNLIANGDFEQAGAPWSIFVPGNSKDANCSFATEASAAREGQTGARMHAEHFARFCISPKPIAVQPGKYEVTAWIRAEDDFSPMRKLPGFVLRANCLKPGEREPIETIGINWKGETSVDLKFPNNDPVPVGWTQIKAIITVPAEAHRMKLDFFYWQAKGTLLVDDVALTRLN